MPGSTTWRARRSASIIGREWGGAERRRETVDLPVAREPVRPMSIIVEMEEWTWMSFWGVVLSDLLGVRGQGQLSNDEIV